MEREMGGGVCPEGEGKGGKEGNNGETSLFP